MVRIWFKHLVTTYVHVWIKISMRMAEWPWRWRLAHARQSQGTTRTLSSQRHCQITNDCWLELGEAMITANAHMTEDSSTFMNGPLEHIPHCSWEYVFLGRCGWWKERRKCHWWKERARGDERNDFMVGLTPPNLRYIIYIYIYIYNILYIYKYTYVYREREGQRER